MRHDTPRTSSRLPCSYLPDKTSLVMVNVHTVLVVLAAAAAGAAAVELCADMRDRDFCVVAAEESETCSWCSVVDGPEGCFAASVARTIGDGACDDGSETVMTRAPVMEVRPSLATAGGASSSTDWVPVVVMHGIGDSGRNPGMRSVAKSIETAYPGMYAVSPAVCDGLSSYTIDMNTQVEKFAEFVRGDPKLARGFTAVGFSQGGLIVRGYVERFNDPPVHRLISLVGPQEGVGDCPGGTPAFLCNMCKKGDRLYDAPVSFSGYWKKASDQEDYLAHSKFLADINNEKSEKKASYKSNMLSLDKYVLGEGLNDTLVHPRLSENHRYWAWGAEGSSSDAIVEFEDMPGYQGDWIGLKTLNEAGKIDFRPYVGEHMRWSSEYWHGTIMPYFNQTMAKVSSARSYITSSRSALVPNSS